MHLLALRSPQYKVTNHAGIMLKRHNPCGQPSSPKPQTRGALVCNDTMQANEHACSHFEGSTTQVTLQCARISRPVTCSDRSWNWICFPATDANAFRQRTPRQEREMLKSHQPHHVGQYTHHIEMNSKNRRSWTGSTTYRVSPCKTRDPSL